MAYELMALLTDRAALNLETLAGLLSARFASTPGATVSLEPHPWNKRPHLALRWGDWSFRVSYEDAPHVVEESREIAEIAAGRPDQDAIAACRTRITMAADDDPGMDHFNDYCFIMEVLEKQPGVVVFDPNTGEFTGG